MKHYYTFIISILIITLQLHIFGRNINEQLLEKLQVSPRNCEENNYALNLIHSVTPESDLIIVIARLGKKEKRKNLNLRRLRNVKVYLTESSWKRNSRTVILAQGDKVNGYGQLEFYVQGKLIDVLTVRNNQDLPVGSCEPKGFR